MPKPIVITIVGDAEKFRGEMRSVDKTAETTGKKLTEFGKLAVAGLAVAATAAVKAFVSDSKRAFVDLNESLNALEVTYGENAEGIKKLGKEAAQSLGLSNAEFNSFAVQMSAFAHQIAGDGGDVIEVVDELSTRVSDFASVMNLEVAEAARLFQSGLAGETEPLRKYGLDMSAAAVKAFALAEGIVDGTGELTEQEKVLARYGLLMKQTDKTAGDFQNTIDELANSERVAAAEMENAKAQLGEALLPLLKLAVPVAKTLASAVSQISLKIRELTGEVTKAEAALQRITIQTGAAADTANVLGTALVFASREQERKIKLDKDGVDSTKGFTQELLDLVDAAGLNEEELRKLRQGLPFLQEETNLTDEAVEALADSIDNKLTLAIRGNRLEEMEPWQGTISDAAEAQEELEGATEDTAAAIEAEAAATQRATERIKAQQAAIRGIHDPLFRMRQQAAELAEAQEAMNTAGRKFGEDSDEYIDAAIEMANKNADLIDTLRDLRDDGINPTGAAARNMLAGLGLPQSVINKLFAQFDALEKNYEGRIFETRVSVPNYRFTDIGGGKVTSIQEGSKIFAQHGGIARSRNGGVNLTAAESGADEALIPMNSEGVGILADALRKAGVGGGPNLVFSGNVYGLDDLEQRVLEMIERARRRGIAV